METISIHFDDGSVTTWFVNQEKSTKASEMLAALLGQPDSIGDV